MNTTVYSQNNCSKCVATKEELSARGVEFTEINMSLDQEARARVKSLGFRQAPVVMVDGDAWSGHDLAQIDRHFPRSTDDGDTWDF